MASTKSAENAVQTKPIEVSEMLQTGEKFVKWDEDATPQIQPCTLFVDKNGFYLYWIPQSNETEILDIAMIRDARTGKYARTPKDVRLKNQVTMGSQDSLEDKTMTICYGSDFVNVTFINFCTTRADIARHWTDQILHLAYNLTQLNTSTTMFLQKAHTRLTLITDKNGNVPVKNVIKMFTQHKDDRKRVEKALESTGHSVGKNDSIPIQKFQFEDFFTFYKALTQRSDVEKIFDQLVGNSKKKLMSAAQLVEFLNQTQRDPRLNEILHPYANTARAMEIITQYEPSKANAQKGYLSSDGFLRYLMSEDNPIMAVSKFELSDDMDQPLAHYFINSSHNTYLTGHQLTGKSSVEIYRQCLLAGCRCVELDFWNGKDAEPVIVHGYTFVPEISARDVLEAIAESAFKTSEYPVILSFENHCNPRQQAKIAQYCREFFGDMLLETPLESHKLEPGQELPPPALLRRKIIIKNKKKHHHHKKHQKKAHQQQPSTEVIDEGNEAGEDNSSEDQSAKGENGPPPDIIPQSEVAAAGETASLDNSSNGGNTGGVVLAQQQSVGNGGVNHPPMLQNRQSSKDSAQDEEGALSKSICSNVADEDEESSLSEEESNVDPVTSEKAADAKETEAGAEISALVNYVQPVHFISFEVAEKKNRLYEMSSFDEKQATTLLKERPLEFVNYNKHQLSRVYPSGTRFDSSNFMPQVFWNAGCQLVALNYQTMDLAMQLNLGIFEYNKRCGYLLKPEFMRRKDRRLDPFAESTVDGIIAGMVHIHVISAQFLTDKRVGTYVEVDMYGLPADTVRKKFRTKIVPNNGINPVYDEEPFIFKKVVLPELASIRIAAYEESGKMIGHRVLPVIGLCPGYRHVALRTECGQSLPLASLFLHVIVKDYVPHGLSDFAEALANPIKYQSELEKRTQQLSVLTDDLEEPKSGEVEEETSALATTAPATAASVTTSGAASSSAKSTQRVRSIGELPTNLAPSSIGSPHGRPSIGAINSADSQELEDGVSALAVTVVDGSSNKSPLNASTSSFSLIAEDIVAESLEKLMENKLVKEKKMELEKKLESLKKKQEKEKVKVQNSKGLVDSDNKKSKFNMGNKLVKRLSSKNISFSSEVALSAIGSLPETTAESPETEGTTDATAALVTKALPRSQSERLLAVCKEHVLQERELQEKYHESMFSTVDKVMKSSQSSQLKALQTLYERETADVKRKLAAKRHDEVKKLAKIHKDKAELDRMKREVAKSTVEKGVNECTRLTKIYDRKRMELEKQHEEVRQRFDDEKAKVRAALQTEYTSRYSKFESGSIELSPTKGGGGGGGEAGAGESAEDQHQPSDQVDKPY
ncbi:1-phosphatidylinositol 4,5-bisphosphate phosphodiesterase classes I and II isoform X1 [Trichogramma pretiosum]|uniref:1-phosphatidylinositol 4,5-bisphosphate phosphodiesterase classes I and II isoform X1 n=1 Tax=Trichogramma pretiosum TaxID=7493 RepID=UPI0006C9E341|nr:1-phosphatidylinositol 4,5-bisphosphate phosphodiesterase classes I and II isoform X1 [Trichogramma pretiosum]XP_014229605.1 1-phosphatidylinositol 4,5-bisphosphate phosphodiesterase classes I and II isoform X1 [Trichogramma pretiosum]XP_014229606.1 1-phosphatidylinositol 4,5-bisphosphate phosphodiesterase classes I and II isoform X1 [Trichogramma pretiosum]XP_014229607.1 1-phosphatidylinositol 4,5-bisphosphate phosphodiesterase classes I and II isoform X1 [Trichogramma pretiosum]XP_02331682